MGETTAIIIITISLACSYVLINLSKTDMTVETRGNVEYMVQNLDDKEEAVDLLDQVQKRIVYFRSYLKQNESTYVPEYQTYVNRLCNGVSGMKLKENPPDGKATSFTLNKGEEMALCLRQKGTHEIHDINLLMYVVIHELSHIACPELHHTPLFKQIFVFMLKQARNAGVYIPKNYRMNPEVYCGMTINEHLVDL